ncbi:hypothetical protein HELRODRAFT_96497 [Helobdella robusta]|uniref:Trimeric intracellular cation channel type B n=1 Tax=Helobdella robusta TaxID=6412 RepID=T1G9C6_HELRO|nr:hypothetical protein HELRODRAFT_96497 [Helobdella robusta]ESN90416.1 hypothetical protein HELRODRAFT_96497 [Helobdella robusta]
MDDETYEHVLEVAGSIKRLKMFPYFEVAHYILMCILVRDDSYSSQIAGPKGFHRNHPLACWVGSMMLCFAGSFVGNFLLGEPLLLTFNNEINIIVASVVWYLINYSPFDFAYQIAKFVPVRMLLMMMQEMMRLNKIYDGTNFAMKNFSGAFIFVCLFGSLKGSATLHIRIIQRLVCGIWSPSSIELLKPSAVAKSSLVAGICFTLYHRKLIDLPEPLVYIGLIFFLWFVRFFWAIFGVDVFKLFENIICFIFFGGLLDWVERKRYERMMSKAEKDAALNGIVNQQKKIK